VDFDVAGFASSAALSLGVFEMAGAKDVVVVDPDTTFSALSLAGNSIRFALKHDPKGKKSMSLSLRKRDAPEGMIESESEDEGWKLNLV